MKQRAPLDLFLTAFFLVILVALLSLSGQVTRQERWDRLFLARSVERGGALYELHCRSCHGVNGEGVGELGPMLNDRVFFTTRLAEVSWPGSQQEYVHQVIAAGRVTATRPIYAGDGVMAMSPWQRGFGGPLTEAQVTDLTHFVLNWEESALQDTPLTVLELGDATQSGDPQKGREVFREAGCGACHALAGFPPPSSPGPALVHIAQTAAARVPGQSAEDYLRESFWVPDAFLVEGYPAPSPCGGLLSDAQLDDLVAFLLAQP